MSAITTIDQIISPLPVRVLNKCAGWLNGAVSRSFSLETALETARRRCSLADFGGNDFIEPLSRLLESCERDAQLNLIGKTALRSDVVRILSNRLLMRRDRMQQPEIADQQIRAPVFIVGLPRTGTTLLHTLLASDRAHRSPLTWEVMEPSPATRANKHRRVERAAQNLAWLERLAPNFGEVHSIGARLPQECVSLMSPSFLSDQFDTMYNVPSYRAWFLRRDLLPAYNFHLQFLQHLQQRKSARRWILKAPAHMFALPTLLAVYPDALFVQTHRAPLQAVTSVSSLITILRRIFSDVVDPIEIGAEALRYWAGTLARFLHDRDQLPAARVFDLDYLELRRDPIAAVHRLYRHFQWSLSSETERRMRAALARQSHGRRTVHRYELERFGFRPEQETEFFGAYCERFGVCSGSRFAQSANGAESPLLQVSAGRQR